MEQPAVPGEDDGSYVTAEAGGFAEQDAVQPGAAGLHPAQGKPKFSNVLPFHGNAATMNLNALILNNIQSSHYFKVDLYSKKTYHEVIDEMYYQVKHLEPWEKGSRKTAGQTGMCGGVRGVGAGGIVSTAFCILYKLYTLKLTRKQLNGLIHYDGAPQIRAIGFMYIRYTQPPADLWTWYEPFLEDEEEVDVRAGGGHPMTVGQMVRSFLTKLDWFSTLFPRIPVPITKDILAKLKEHDDKMRAERGEEAAAAEEELDKEKKRSAPRDVIEKTDARDRGVESRAEREVDRRAKDRDRRSGDRDRDRNHERSRRSRSRERDLSRKDREREPRDKGALKRSRSRDLEWKGRDERDGKRSRSGDTERNKRSRDEESERRSRDRHDVRSRDGDYRRPKYKARSRSRSRDRDRRR